MKRAHSIISSATALLALVFVDGCGDSAGSSTGSSDAGSHAAGSGGNEHPSGSGSGGRHETSGSASGGASATGAGGSGGGERPDCAVDAPPPGKEGLFPLDELVGGSYKGFSGGLYPGANTPPCAHRAAGLQAANAVRPLDGNGNPSASGKVVLVSIGMSNTTQEFCSQQTWIQGMPCAPQSFMGAATADSDVDHASLVIVDGAYPSQVAEAWADPDNAQYDANYERVKTRLEAGSATEAQVQAVWLKVADPTPLTALPSASADAYRLQGFIGRILRNLAARYPNLKLVFGSSRTYGGYAVVPLNPEPYAYESAFAVKWAIEAQIKQIASGTVDPTAGDLDYRNGTAPWYGWGAYLWADGTTPRESDGLTWLEADFDPQDGTHPMPSARQKVGALLLRDFKTSPFTRCWFLADHPACE